MTLRLLVKTENKQVEEFVLCENSENSEFHKMFISQLLKEKAEIKDFKIKEKNNSNEKAYDDKSNLYDIESLFIEDFKELIERYKDDGKVENQEKIQNCNNLLKMISITFTCEEEKTRFIKNNIKEINSTNYSEITKEQSKEKESYETKLIIEEKQFK